MLAGLALGVAFNPLVSIVGAPLAAALYGAPRRGREHHAWAVAAVAVAWLVGDGFRVMGRLRDVLDGRGLLLAHAPPWASYAALAAWAIVGLALGYALPAALGAYVGRRVVRGTGWLSAIGVAAATSAALAALAGPASVWLERLALVVSRG
jgi:hypothetical protein